MSHRTKEEVVSDLMNSFLEERNDFVDRVREASIYLTPEEMQVIADKMREINIQSQLNK